MHFTVRSEDGVIDILECFAGSLCRNCDAERVQSFYLLRYKFRPDLNMPYQADGRLCRACVNLMSESVVDEDEDLLESFVEWKRKRISGGNVEVVDEVLERFRCRR